MPCFSLRARNSGLAKARIRLKSEAATLLSWRPLNARTPPLCWRAVLADARHKAPIARPPNVRASHPGKTKRKRKERSGARVWRANHSLLARCGFAPRGIVDGTMPSEIDHLKSFAKRSVHRFVKSPPSRLGKSRSGGDAASTFCPQLHRSNRGVCRKRVTAEQHRSKTPRRVSLTSGCSPPKRDIHPIHQP